jgi:hypothetical protein
MQLGTENTDAVDANLVAGWQPLVDPELEEEDKWCDTDVDPTSRPILGKSGISIKSV